MQIMTRQKEAIVAIVGAQSGVSVSTIKGRLHQGLSISMGRFRRNSLLIAKLHCYRLHTAASEKFS